MTTFRNHKGKIILIVSLLLTYPVFLAISIIKFPHMGAAIISSFMISYITFDIIARSIADLVYSENVLYTKQSLDESDMLILWNQVNNNTYVRIDINQQNFIISIRIQKSNHNISSVYFYLLDADGVFHKENNSETFDSIQFSEFLDYESFKILLRRKYEKLILKGKELYGNIN